MENFKRINKIYPMNLVFFRDGVAEGQRSAIQDNEITAIKRVF